MQASVFAHRSLITAGIALLLASGAAWGVMWLGPSTEQVSGNINVKLTLVSGCVVNGAGGSSGASTLDFGTIDFGSQPIHFAQTDVALHGSAGSGITVQCSAGNAPVLAFDAGLHEEATGTRQLANGAARVPYRLYKDTVTGVEIAANGVTNTVSLLGDGSGQTVNIIARATNPNAGSQFLTPGNYTDTIGVTLSF